MGKGEGKMWKGRGGKEEVKGKRWKGRGECEEEKESLKMKEWMMEKFEKKKTQKEKSHKGKIT